MASFVLRDPKLWLQQYRLDSSLNQLALTDGVEALDDSAFGDATRTHKPGISSVAMSYAGFFEAGTDLIDDVINVARGTENQILSVGPITGAEGERAFTFRALHTDVRREGRHGALALVNVSAAGSSGEPLVVGAVMASRTVIGSASGSGAVVLLGPVGADQKVYLALHVLSISGGAVSGTLKSASTIGMGSAATRLTTASHTTPGAQWLSAAGPITDSYWRFDFTHTGAATFVVVAGIV